MTDDPVLNILLNQQVEMRQEIAATSKSIAEIREMLAEQRGQWKGAKAVAAGVSATIGFLMGVVNFIITHQFNKPGG